MRTASAALLSLSLSVPALAEKIDVLPKSYLPPQNLSIQETIDHVLSNLEAMKTYGELHRTLKVFRPTSDHKALAAILKGHETDPLPRILRKGMTAFYEIPGQGRVEIEFVNIEKGRFRIQGAPYVFQIQKPFSITLSEIHQLLFKSPSSTHRFFSFDLFPQALAESPPEDRVDGAVKLGQAFLKDILTGKLFNQANCSGDPGCAKEIERQKNASKTAGTVDTKYVQLQKNGEDLARASQVRSKYCANQGRDLPKNTSPQNIEACKGAIATYERACEYLKSPINYTRHLVYMDGNTPVDASPDVFWKTIDCKKHVWFFKTNSVWKAHPLSSEGGKGL